MSKLPLVAIIGRPNTGKSSLFNALIGERRAIVSDIPGTTRDQVAQRVKGEDVDYLLLDTAGIGGGSSDLELEDDVTTQTTIALQAADVILFTVNGREELTRSDFVVADLLRRHAKRHVPVFVLLTKCDNDKQSEDALLRGHELGLEGELLAVSSMQGTGLGELTRAVESALIGLHFSRPDDTPTTLPRVAIVGRPNVGKSSLVNALMSDPDRARTGRLVSPIPGTTRDASDTTITCNDKEYIFVDTAGLRRQARVEDGIEYFSTLRSLQAIEQADIVLLVVPADEPINRQDKRIARHALDAGKGLIILLNKCDLLSAGGKEAKAVEIRSEMPFCKFCPILGVSAVERAGLVKMFPVIDIVLSNRQRRIATKDLIRWYTQTRLGRPLGAAAKGKFITQAEDVPPTFVLFVPRPTEVHAVQLRALEGSLRSTFTFDGSPIRWRLRPSKKDKED
jgi:GTP-binding protein